MRVKGNDETENGSKQHVVQSRQQLIYWRELVKKAREKQGEKDEENEQNKGTEVVEQEENIGQGQIGGGLILL